ncbi:uncharacterized protein LOC127004695 [Eriocheir sinensis]|uniref:uncharacterized protein LOC127004695 n=1 Tax=Eriocheir sinensis TaxID=95602 RepID=UPI0021C839D3|nr:uncharacterized protein LOC127004695 [Eriocheir sinensis]
MMLGEDWASDGHPSSPQPPASPACRPVPRSHQEELAEADRRGTTSDRKRKHRQEPTTGILTAETAPHPILTPKRQRRAAPTSSSSTPALAPLRTEDLELSPCSSPPAAAPPPPFKVLCRVGLLDLAQTSKVHEREGETERTGNAAACKLIQPVQSNPTPPPSPTTATLPPILASTPPPT